MYIGYLFSVFAAASRGPGKAGLPGWQASLLVPARLLPAKECLNAPRSLHQIEIGSDPAVLAYLRLMRTLFRTPFADTLACLERVMAAPTVFRAMGPMLIAMAVTWFLYVPIHELLHVLGCVVTGGSVSRLELSPQYGAAWLAKVFPFITSGSDYAGRLSGFDTKGSDLIYLATDFMPFVLSVVIGVPLIRLCTRKRRPILFGAAVVVGLAPFYNIPGDYYEMGSIITTRALTLLRGGGNPPAFAGIRSDDIYLLIEKLILRPAEIGLEGVGTVAAGVILIFVALALDVLLAFATYGLGTKVANVICPRTEGAAGR